MPREHLPLALDVLPDHPLATELASLRAALERYQHESHSGAVKLQRHSLDTTNALERAQGLERENSILRAELTQLRAHPVVPPQPAQQHAAELTLALRHVSEQRTLAEETLLVRTKELAHARSEARRAEVELTRVLSDASAARAREEAANAREREMAGVARAAEAERRMVDGVVRQYADLVRSIDARQSKRPQPSPADSAVTLAASPDSEPETQLVDPVRSDTALTAALAEGKTGLKRLLADSNQEASRLQQEISRLHAELEASQREQEAMEKVHSQDRTALAQALVELERLRVDDTTAAKMVSRYMKFSQQSTNTLQSALDTHKVRHAATLATLSAELSAAQSQLRDENRFSERLRRALDALAEDVAREAYGRRREVALRLAALGREEQVVEGLRRWRRRAGEGLARVAAEHPYLTTSPSASPSTSPAQPTAAADAGPNIPATLVALRDALERMLYDADDLLAMLDSLPTPRDPTGEAGGAARVLLAEDTARTLLRELQRETDRRMELEIQVHCAAPPPPSEAKRRRAGLHARATSLPATAVLDGLGTPPPAPTPKAATAKLPALGGLPIAHTSVAPGGHSEPPSQHTASQKEDLPVPSVSISEPGLSSRATAPGSPVALSPIPPPLDVTANTATALSHPIDHPVGDANSTGNTNINTAELHHPVPIPARIEEPAFIVPDDDSDTRSSPIHHSEPAPINSPPHISAQLEPVIPPIHPLLNDLHTVKHRYDELTRAFRDCHLALLALQRDLLVPSEAFADTSTTAILRSAVERLQDFNEDARVELEIRIADEERLAHGYAALLAMPQGLHGTSAERDAARFISGEDERVARAFAAFRRKRAEVEHDVAEVKRVLHALRAGTFEPPAEGSPGSLALDASPSPPASLASPRGWTTWAGGMLPGSRPSSPAPPTFGSVMTVPRLRHVGSSPSLSLSTRRPSTPSLPLMDSPMALPADPGRSPFARLGLELKVPMPAHVAMPEAPPTPGMLAPKPPPLRPRYSSMFRNSSMLGIGAGSRSPLVNGSGRVVTSPVVVTNASAAGGPVANSVTEETKEGETDLETEDETDTDVE